MKMLDVLGCAGAVMVIFLAFSWIPFIGPFISLLTPLPFLFYAIKLGRYKGTLVILFAFFVVSVIAVLIKQPGAIYLCIEHGLLGLILAELYRRELSFGYIMLWATSIILAFGAGLMLLSDPTGSINSWLDLIVRAPIKEMIKVFEQGEPDQEKVRQFRELTQGAIKIVEQIYPALLIMTTGLIIWFNVTASKILFRLAGLKYPDFGDLNHWKAPEWLVWPMIAAGFTLIFSIQGITFWAINILVIVGCIYAFHGFTIIGFFFKKHHVPRWCVFLFYFSIFWSIYLLMGIALAGVFDQWFDFRKLKPKDTLENGTNNYS